MKRFEIIPGEKPDWIGRAGWIIATKPAYPDNCKGCYLSSRGINCGCLCTEGKYINAHLKVNFHRIKDGDVVKDTNGKVWLAHQIDHYHLNLSPHGT